MLPIYRLFNLMTAAKQKKCAIKVRHKYKSNPKTKYQCGKLQKKTPPCDGHYIYSLQTGNPESAIEISSSGYS